MAATGAKLAAVFFNHSMAGALRAEFARNRRDFCRGFFDE
jgi:hypothetical protein